MVNGVPVTADQDSDAEIASCMAVICLWPIGTRETDVEFGIDEQAFLENGADLGEIRDALTTYEPRAVEDIVGDDTQLDGWLSAVRVGWDATQGDPGR
jgi:hypothetical protein